MTEEKISILLVCTGNTCRSPMAEGLLLREWGRHAGLPPLETASAGLAAADGEKASRYARAVMREAGDDLESHRSVLLSGELVGRASLILVMSRSHRAQLLRLFPAAAAKTYLFKEFAGIEGDPDVADPYGGAVEDYRRVYMELRAGIAGIIDKFERGGNDEGSSRQ